MSLKTLLIFLVAIFLANYLGNSQGWYWTIPWYDIPMHIAGGVWAALFFFYLFEARMRVFDPRKDLMRTFFLVLGFVALIGVFWELYEYFTDIFFAAIKYTALKAQGGGFDTIKDLFDDILGASFGFFGWLYAKKSVPAPERLGIRG